MPPAARVPGSAELPLDVAMVGILAMLVAEREDRMLLHDPKAKAEPRKTEVVLADAGLSAIQIGRLPGKKPNTVLKTISRARGKTDTGSAGVDGLD
jgi:hypothetical protein